MPNIKTILAKKELNKSVVAINPDIKEEIATKKEDALFIGIKNTAQIPDFITKRLRNHPKLVWHTIDKAADKGRAIDPDLNNPVTYRLMTGSTSGGPINILKGINDIAIGTDGGGSVLGPAMSCQLPSMIGAGLGLQVKNKKVSTDGKTFRGSVGVIGKELSVVLMVMELLTKETLSIIDVSQKLKIAIPKKGTVVCPDHQDMHQKVTRYLSRIDCGYYDIQEIDMTGIEDRHIGMRLIEGVFQNKVADLILTCEGPIDVYGYGETIPQQFGETGLDITRKHGKFLLRSANMTESTAITVPTENLASGLLVISKKGLVNSRHAIGLAKKLEQSIYLPAVWKRYFLTESLTLDYLDF
ncbi:hypothetical protein P5G51_016420 [Virgibacillus sp. 179-BFC.A HS]|uniref:Amidase n=1 Tax=Tigheibacillus jepli TaxID=3035914 RepID=A0ABU5CK56_9BACI|nr:hypothetical protein [Virgibacillus sp. 179-BFC.A HS]MDY0406731.1 hypothetical protein [Virgibacillus sp. 179-BFC.A HS]